MRPQPRQRAARPDEEHIFVESLRATVNELGYTGDPEDSLIAAAIG
jgi:hypothetical protein